MESLQCGTDSSMQQHWTSQWNLKTVISGTKVLAETQAHSVRHRSNSRTPQYCTSDGRQLSVHYIDISAKSSSELISLQVQSKRRKCGLPLNKVKAAAFRHFSFRSSPIDRDWLCVKTTHQTLQTSHCCCSGRAREREDRRPEDLPWHPGIYRKEEEP